MAEKYEVGKVYKIEKDNGKTVERKCVGIIDPKFLEEQEQLKNEIGFAPMFIKDGVAFLSMTAPDRNKLSPEEKARREKEAKKRSEAFRKRRIESAKKKKEEAERKLKELEG